MPQGHGVRLSLQIIESPSPDEIFNARTEGSVLSQTLRLSGIPVSYNISVNIDKFVDALGFFASWRVQDPNALPILHLSMHGHPEGVSLTDGFFLTWDQLGKMLLHVAQGQLLVSMSSCFGFSGCRMAMSEYGNIPFMGLVGHDAKVNLDDSAVAYAAFYHRLFKGDTVPVAVEAMQKASGDNRFMTISGAEARNIWKRHVSQAQAEATRANLEKYLASLPRQPRQYIGAIGQQQQ